MALYTITTAAAELGCHKSNVSRYAARHGLGMRIGRLVILSARDVSRLRRNMPGRTGNPNFIASNNLGLPTKKIKKKTKKGR